MVFYCVPTVVESEGWRFPGKFERIEFPKNT